MTKRPTPAARPALPRAERECGNCSHSHGALDGGLECHRSPPAAGRMRDTAGRWPLVKSAELCGEWKDMRDE